MEEFRHAVEAGFYAEAAYQEHHWLEVSDAARFLPVEVLVRPPDKARTPTNGTARCA